VSDRGRSWRRREFVGGLVLGGTASFLRAGVDVAAADSPPETTKLRVLRTPSLCEAPAQVAATLLATEGFTEVHYVQVGGSDAAVKGFVAGEVDVGLLAIPGTVLRREFVRKHPVATKRAMRAIFKADAMCALEPTRVTQLMVERGYTANTDLAARTLREIPYVRWRQHDAEDTVRFFALRLNEAGLIKSSPQKIIAQGTDWRFFNELKKELKG
jgi:ABC-type nitrate/sulfonate/bicarbonate transport system substrate-binding protein